MVPMFINASAGGAWCFDSTTMAAFREVGAVLTRRLYNIYKYDFDLFGYKADKYLSRD